jgi:hypothetical protein
MLICFYSANSFDALHIDLLRPGLLPRVCGMRENLAVTLPSFSHAVRIIFRFFYYRNSPFTEHTCSAVNSILALILPSFIIRDALG